MAKNPFTINGFGSIPIKLPDMRPAHEVAETVNGLSRPRVITAASKKVDLGKDSKYSHRQMQSVAWQQEAWAIYDQVGELHFAANLYANGLSRIRLEPARRAKGNEAPIRLCELKDSELTPKDRQILEIMHDFTAEQTLCEMSRLWGLNKFIAGEGYLVGIPYKGRSGRRRKMMDYTWKVYSREDIRAERGKVVICGEEYSESSVLLIRLWQPHPRTALESDSPVRAALPILRELIGLTMHVSALIDSRLAGAGILLVPTSATVLGGTGAEDDQEEDPVIAALIEAMLTAIKDRDSGAAVVPLVLTAPDDSIGLIRHLSFASPLDAATKELRDEAIRRLALAMDMPPEQLLGLGTSSHWNAWAVQEDTVKLHLIPGAKILSDAIVQEFLQPVLEELKWPEEDIESYFIDCVADNLISRPNHFDEALELYKVDAITMESLVKAGGFSISDMPEKKEDFDRSVELAIKAISINPSLFQDPGLPNLVSQLRAILAGQDSSTAPPEATPPRAQVAPLEPGSHESNTPDPDRPNTPGPPRSSPAGPDKA